MMMMLVIMVIILIKSKACDPHYNGFWFPNTYRGGNSRNWPPIGWILIHPNLSSQDHTWSLTLI